MEDFEKLGSFYLGRVYDLETRRATDELVLYDAKDLVTHAVCVGMTGSGKTGLCLSLIEEAAIDGVPVIAIDPKGDLGNLLLTFPGLRGEDFRPWINLDEARQKGLTPEAFADSQAETWRNGLAGWGQTGERIQRLRDAVDLRIYTPGSQAGIPVSILKSFAAPEAALRDEGDLMRERIGTTVSSLLGLLGIAADPIQSREHILLSTILDHGWRQGRDLDLATLIQQVQTPPMTQIGVLDLESFYPAKERFGLVMALNNLLASPGFGTWLEGTPLDIGQLLYSPGGKPRVAIFSIAHLSDPERMFFVSLLMNQILGWMRGQAGTTSLRALVYMDEIFGYLPPVENPPSKLPILTLLKQARAFGVGLVLATQNPVDLDYKALSNMGTWFIGRLQTERDKARLLDGLCGAADNARFDKPQLERLLAGLGNRVFLMNNTHDDAPELIQTRWALSYLRGPLTREQIRTLMAPVRAAERAPTGAAPVAGAAPAGAAATATGSPPASTGKPAVPPDVHELFLPVRSLTPGASLRYEPRIVGVARIELADAKTNVDVATNKVVLARITDEAIPVKWDGAEVLPLEAARLEKAAPADARFTPLPPCASQAKKHKAWAKDLADWLQESETLRLWRSPALKVVSRPGEDERGFRIRMQQLAREKRDELVDELRKKYAPKLAALEERLRRAQAVVQKQQEQARQAKMDTAFSVGTALFGMLAGRRGRASVLGRAGSAARRAGRVMQENGDVLRASDTVASLHEQLRELGDQLDAEVAALAERFDPSAEALETIAVRPKKADVNVQLIALAWAPYWQDTGGGSRPAY